MVFRRKVLLLSLIICSLSFIYAASFFFDPELKQDNELYAWLDERFLPYADAIEIAGSAGNIVFTRKNNIWVVSGYSNFYQRIFDYPASQNRINDLLGALTRRGHYPVRSELLDKYEQYGLGANTSRIIIYGGAGLPLLDLYVGYIGHTGQIFLRKSGKQIRSGEDIFTVYTENGKAYWFDLRIFAELHSSAVQRIGFIPPEGFGAGLYYIRNRNFWINENDGSVMPEFESIVRSVTETHGEDFFPVDAYANADWMNFGSIGMWLDDGSYRNITLGTLKYNHMGNAVEGNAGAVIYLALVPDTGLVYVLSEWTIRRIWPQALLQ